MSFGRGDVIFGPATEHLGGNARILDLSNLPTEIEKTGQLKSGFLVSSGASSTSHHTQQEIVHMDLHHPILREFPEHRDTIKRLKSSSDHFRSLFEEYHRLDDQIYQIEEEIDFATDQEIEELKMRRAKLKDYIYHLVRHAPPACPACEGTGISTSAQAAA